MIAGILAHVCTYNCEYVSRTTRDMDLPVLLTYKSKRTQVNDCSIAAYHIYHRGLILMYSFLLPVLEFPPLGGCRKMQITELPLSPLKVERYATVRAHMGNALGKYQTQSKRKPPPPFTKPKQTRAAVTLMLDTESKL